LTVCLCTYVSSRLVICPPRPSSPFQLAPFDLPWLSPPPFTLKHDPSFRPPACAFRSSLSRLPAFVRQAGVVTLTKGDRYVVASPWLALPRLAGAHASPFAAIRSPRPVCNGHAELCDKSFGNVTFIGAHDSCEWSSLSLAGRREQAGATTQPGEGRHMQRRPSLATPHIAPHRPRTLSQRLVSSSDSVGVTSTTFSHGPLVARRPRGRCPSRRPS
jgi:hypothetical protein